MKEDLGARAPVRLIRSKESERPCSLYVEEQAKRTERNGALNWPMGGHPRGVSTSYVIGSTSAKRQGRFRSKATHSEYSSRLRWHLRPCNHAPLARLLRPDGLSQSPRCPSAFASGIFPSPVRANAVGIDVGLSSFAVLSDGSEIENPRLYH